AHCWLKFRVPAAQPGSCCVSGTSAEPQSRREPPARRLERLARGDGAAADLALASGALDSPTRVVPRATVKAPSRVVRIGRVRLPEPPKIEVVSARNWMKCAGLAYSDENWELADPKREPRPRPPPAEGGAEAKKPAPPAGSEGSEILEKVSGFLGPLVSFVLPMLGHAPKMVKDMAH